MNGSRRGVILAGCLVVIAALAWRLAPTAMKPAGSAPVTARPNVVLIVLDTTRGDRCSVNGHDRPTTPELEALAREGAVFRDCWSPAPWTAPAHASLFTGLRPSHHGLTGGKSYFLSDARETLAEVLGLRGYATACFTANEFITPAFGLTQGFALVDPVYAWPDSAYPYAPAAHELAGDWALARHAAGLPFFLFVNDIEPHAPFTPPDEVAARFIGDATPDEIAAARQIGFPASLAINIGKTTVPPRILEVAKRLYDAEIATVDAAVGALARRLRDAGILDETVFVVVGDHGENLGDRGLVDHMFSIHRSLLHVPLVIRYPPAFAPGTVVDDVTRLEDVHATLVDLLGLPTPKRQDGRTLRGDTSGRVAIGDYGIPLTTMELVRERHPDADLARFAVRSRSIYDGRHHLIRYSDGRQELYDVRADPLETRDLAGTLPDVEAALRESLGP